MPQYRSKRNESRTPISQDEVFFLLEPVIGLPLLLKHSELVSDLTALLCGFRWHHGDSIDELYRELESTLFNGVYEYTKGKMSVTDADGKHHKIYTDALSQTAEMLLEPLFERFPVCERTFGQFNDYALRHLSLPAIKRLYVDYGDKLLPMNKAIYARILVENFPKESYEAWLTE